MLTQLHLSFGAGRAGIHCDVARDRDHPGSRRLGLLAFLLTLPIVLLLGAQVIGSISGRYSLDRLMNAPGQPWLAVLSAATLSTLLALALLAAARLRMAAARADGTWTLAVSMRVTILEATVLAIGLALVLLFVAHLFADDLACARGVREAC